MGQDDGDLPSDGQPEAQAAVRSEPSCDRLPRVERSTYRRPAPLVAYFAQL